MGCVRFLEGIAHTGTLLIWIGEIMSEPGGSRSWESPKAVVLFSWYLFSVSELNIKFFIKHLKSVPNKVIRPKTTREAFKRPARA